MDDVAVGLGVERRFWSYIDPMADRTGLQADEIDYGTRDLPEERPGELRAWLHGKLFTSLLVERLIGAAKDFPWGYEIG